FGIGNNKGNRYRRQPADQEKQVVAKSTPVVLQCGAHQEKDVPDEKGKDDIGHRWNKQKRENAPDLSLQDQGRDQREIFNSGRPSLCQAVDENLTNNQPTRDIRDATIPESPLQPGYPLHVNPLGRYFDAAGWERAWAACHRRSSSGSSRSIKAEASSR